MREPPSTTGATGQHLLVAIGVFLVACYFGHYVGSLLAVDNSPTARKRPSAAVVARGLERLPEGEPGSRLLEGNGLHQALHELVEFATIATDTDARYVTRIYRFAESIPLKEFPSVLKSLQEGGTERNAMVRADLLTYWMEHDFKAARSYFIALPARDRDWMNKVADAWARMDSGSLVAWLTNLPEDERKAIAEDVRSGAAEALAQRDPSTALEVIASMSDGRGSYGEIESTIFQHWARKDPLAAAAHVLEMPVGTSRRRAFSSVLAEWLDTDSAAAREWVLQITDPDLAREAANEFGAELLKTDPEAALKFAAERGVLAQFKYTPTGAWSEWVERDGAGAVEWARTLDDAESRDTILPQILTEYAKHEPHRSAGIYLAESARGATLEGAGGEIVRELGKAGQLDYAISFISQLPEPDQLNVANESCWRLLQDVDPQAVVNAGLKLPSEATRQRWLDRAFGCLIDSRGFEKASRVLDGMPAGAERHVAAAAMIEEALAGAPGQVVALSKTVPGGHASLVKAAAHWLVGDNPSAARNWVSQTDALTPEEKQHLLVSPNSRGNAAAAGIPGDTPKGSVPRP